MADTLLFTLPHAPERDRADTSWWHVVDGEVVSAGTGEEWLTFVKGQRRLIGIAPAADVRLNFSEKPQSAATARQAEAVARVAAVGSSLDQEDSLHAASAVTEDGEVVTAVTDRERLAAWLDWARTLGAEPNHVVPAGAILPLADHWRAAAFGTESVVGRRGTILPNEPDIAGFFVGEDDVETLDEEQVRSALAHAAEVLPIDLRTGRFSRRRRIALEKSRVRELVILASLIPLLLLAWALVVIVRLERSTDRLNSETVALASTALGRPVALESAASELAGGASGSPLGGLMAPLTAVYQALQPEQSVSATSLSYASDGTLSVTFAAPQVDAVNRVLIALQRNGYRVTAVPRQSPDGRSMVDATVRSGP